MKNWRTTIAGLLVGLPVAMQAILEAYTAGTFTDKTGMQLFAAIGLIVITRLTKDHNVTGTASDKTDIQKLLDQQNDDIGGGGIQNPKP